MLILNQILWTIQLGQIFYNEETQAGHRAKLATPGWQQCVCVCVCVSQVVGDKVCRAGGSGLSARSSAKARNNQISNLVFGLPVCLVCRPFGSPCSKPKGKHLRWMCGKRFAYFYARLRATLNWIPYSNSREISVSILSNYRLSTRRQIELKCSIFA